MYKIVYFLVFGLYMNTFLYAKEPYLAILDNVVSNEIQEFHTAGYSFICKPYGVLSIEELYNNSKLDSVCRKSIYTFYEKYPTSRYYAQKILRVQQMYHIEFKNRECILYALGEKTLSELLVENGLAVVKPIFKDEEFRYLFFEAQMRAKVGKHGLWREKITNKCIEEVYK
jgi:hypothetical protein